MLKKISFLLVSVLVSQSTFAANGSVELLTLSTVGGTQNTSILSLIEELEEQGKLEVTSMDRGIVYRRGKLHILADGPRELQFLNSLDTKNKKNIDSYTAFSTARSTMLLSPNTPEGLIRLLSQKVNSYAKSEGYFRHWSDLKQNKASGGTLGNSSVRYLNFGDASWEKDQNWHSHFRFIYRFRYQGKDIVATAIPKDFGNLYRFVSTLKRERRSNSIVISTGGITSRSNQRAKSILQELSRTGPIISAAQFREIVGKKTILDPYISSWAGSPPIEVVSVNAFEKVDGKEQRLFKPYKIVAKNGLKIAFLGITGLHYGPSLVKRSSAQPWLANVVIKDPIPILDKEIIPEVRDKADLVVLLSSLHEPDYGKIERNLEYVDIVARKHNIVFTQHGVHSFSMKNYRQRNPQFPLLDIHSRHNSIAKTQIEIRNGNLKYQHRDIIQSPKLPTSRSEINTTGDFSSLLSKENPILPDHSELYGKQGIENVSRKDVDRLSAYHLKKFTDSEVGIYASHELNAHIIGRIDASILNQWIRSDESLVIGYLTGAELASLFEGNKNSDEFNKLVFAGMPDSKTVNTSPLQANELYKVALGSTVADNVAHHPAIANLRNKTHGFIRDGEKFEAVEGGFRVSLRDFYTEVLTKTYSEKLKLSKEERIDYYKSIYEARPEPARGFWLHDFKSIRLTYSKVSTTDTTAFSNVTDSRLATDDQETLGGSIRYSAIYRRHPYITELGIRGDFSKTEVTQSDKSVITNVTNDDLVYFANIGFPWLKIQNYPSWAAQAGPFFEVAYDTEFEKGSGQELEKKIDGILGFKFYDGAVVKNFTVGVINSSNLTVGQEKNEWGITSRFESNYGLLAGRAMWRTEAEYQYFFETDKDSNADLKYRFTVDNYFDMKIFGKFAFGPYFKYFNFAAKTTDDVGTQTEFGLSLNFSSMWKPKYQRGLF